jgi:hypothetical protein
LLDTARLLSKNITCQRYPPEGGGRSMARRQLANWLWGAAYLLAMALAVLSLFNLRQSVLREMATPQARQDWEKVREAARATNRGEGPVKRRVPASDEPPALVLMRDYFAVLLVGALVFGSALFVTVMIAVKGVLQPQKMPHAPPGEASPGT